ncbi:MULTISPECIES: hypothetical protein [unclassified Bradyrhizobium]|uniref:hypothetical protein n=1 Tax=unclassified Bradyrhizobium TaxID=2631580 RepID=UPI002916AA36|nr:MULTISPECIES: hypothetical protein [unclassified Bradyrhizobium]
MQKLLLFEQQIADGEVQLVRQENLITKMEVGGQDTAEMKAALITMRTTLAQLRQERRRILDLLDE